MATVNAGLGFSSPVASGGTAHVLNTTTNYTAGTLLSLQNNSVVKFTVNYQGDVSAAAGAFSATVQAVATNDTTAIGFHAKTSASTGQGYFAVEGSAGGGWATGTSPYYTVVAAAASGTGVQLATPGGVGLTVNPDADTAIANDLTVAGDTILATKTPASAGATGTLGTVAWDASYIYVCTATNTWKRAAISTW